MICDVLNTDATRQGRLKFYQECMRNLEFGAGDLVNAIRKGRRDPKWAVAQSRTLLYGQPAFPFLRGVLVEFDWEGIQANVKEWEEASSRYPSLSFEFGSRYLQLGRYDDAERCFKAAIKIVPSPAAHQQLALVYKQRGEPDRWLATLEEYLKKPDYGLDHDAVREGIARQYMEQKEWAKALPYTEAAAEGYSGSGLLLAAECYEGLQRWDKAEQYYRACLERYRKTSLEWYFFCRRNGVGDVDGARRVARSIAKNPADLAEQTEPHGLIAYYLLEEQPEKALAEIVQMVNKKPTANDALWMAVIADQVKDAAKRDRALESVKNPSAEMRDNDKPVPITRYAVVRAGPQGAAILADLFAKDLAEGGKGQIDLEAADRLSAP